MPAFILHLGQQRCFAAQAWRAGNPVALWQHADNFRMRVLADLANKRTAISFGHRIVWLNLLLVINARLKPVEKFLVLGRAPRFPFTQIATMVSNS
jgi:hypothetical protein